VRAALPPDSYQLSAIGYQWWPERFGSLRFPGDR
jgi:hypothetical protein